MTAMLEHQESFAKTLYEMYAPISGSRSVSATGEAVTTGKKQRPVTPEKTLRTVQEFIDSATRVKEQLKPELVSCATDDLSVL
jgi:hypothetical protein